MSYRYSIADPTRIDAVGFQARRRGQEVRDCVLLLEPGPKTLLGLLTKSPGTNTVVEEVVRGEASVLDIDECRVQIQAGDTKQATAGNRTIKWGVAEGGCSYEKGTGATFTNEGRWPANLILRHDRGCRCEGTKKVKGDARIGGEGRREGGFMNVGAAKGSSAPNSALYGNEDGTEEVANWICAPTCPVAALDAQSGNRPGCKSPSNATQTSIYRPGQGSYQKQGPIYGDKGGASRFFKQVQTKEERDSYLDRLVRFHPVT